MKRDAWLRIALALAVVAIGIAACTSLAPKPGAVSCPAEKQALIVVNTITHTLALCENGHAAGTFTVRLGSNGTGKSREGDGKTPIGRYGLAEPWPSQNFGTFALVEYPTAEQRSRGFTGSAIGVHGPHRLERVLGSFVNTFDSTDGCIGIATDDEMKRVVDWMGRRGATQILIE